MKKQEYLEQQVTAIVTNDNDLIKDPNLKPELFTIPVYQEMIMTCQKVAREKGSLKLEYILPVFSQRKIDTLFLSLMDISFEKSRYEEFLEELQTSLSIRRSREFLDEVEREELTFDEFQVNVAKLGNEYNLGTSSKWSADQIMYELQRHEEKIRFNRNLFYSEVVQPSKKTVNVIGARTGVGKSAFALNVLNDLADKYMCLYFNLEMTEKEIYQRLMAIQSGIAINRFGKLTDKEKGFLSDAAFRFERDLKIKLYNGSKSMEGIVKIVARESRREHCIVFIDHIGYITNRKISNTRERIQNTMIELNTMSKDYDCTVFALSQLNRDTEGTPKLVNLKDSGEVEQTAHSIVLLNDLTKDFNASVSDYELICAKNRGMTGRRKVYFNKYNQRFYEK